MLPVVREAKQIPADRHPALGFSAIHDLTERLILASALDRLGADTEEGGDLLVGALHPTELFEFGEIDLHLRPRHSSPFLFEKPQFRVPVGEREAQSFQVRMAGED